MHGGKHFMGMLRHAAKARQGKKGRSEKLSSLSLLYPPCIHAISGISIPKNPHATHASNKGHPVAQLYPHYNDFKGQWPWANFTQREVACPCCGELYLDADSMDAIQALRDDWGEAIIINSGHRCAKHNAAVGGAPNSQHLKIAFDCACPKAEQESFIILAKDAGFTGIGRYLTFVHLDRGPKREW